jgi:hypothetical protein
MNTTRKGLAALGCIALVAGAAAACGTVKQASAEVRVQDAFTKLEAGKGVTAQVSIGATADQLYAALKHESGFQRSDATTLAALRVVLSVGDGGKPLSQLKTDDKSAAFDAGVSFDSGTSQAVEVRGIGTKVYLRLGLKSVESLSGMTAEDRAQIDGFVKASAKLPSSYASVKDLIKGDWVSIDPQAFEQFSQSMAKSMGGASVLPKTALTPKIDPKTSAKVTAAFRKALQDNATFRDAGTTGGVDHITVTVKAGPAAKELATGLKPLAKQLGGLPVSELNKMPAKNVTVSVGIKNGTVSGITVDLAQFDTKAAGKIPLVIALSGDSAELTAPAGAVPLNPQDIMGAMMSLAGNGAFGPQGFSSTGKGGTGM